MKVINTFGGQTALRHLSLGCLFTNKAAGMRMTQVTAFATGEAATGIDTQTKSVVVWVRQHTAGGHSGRCA